jgi:hypothetical protein
LTHEERVQAVVEYGFTEQQARFLVLVLRHGGICVPRQYAAFAGIPHGGKRCNALFDKLVRREYAVASECIHNRARLYHLHHKALYQAIGESTSRYRRRVSARGVIERVMLLDAVLTTPNLNWLTSDSEKASWVAAVTSDAPSSNTSGMAAEPKPPTDVECSDRFPIGVDPAGRVVVSYLATRPWPDDFRSFLQRTAPLLRIASMWTLRIVFPQPVNFAYDAYQSVIRDELETPIHAATITELKWYFEQRHRTAREPVGDITRGKVEGAGQVFGTPRFSLLYRRWLKQGDAVFETLSSTAIPDAMTAGTGRVECVALPYTYRHLSPVVEHAGSSRGVEKGERGGERTSARPQHRSSTPVSIGSASALL